MTMLLRGALAGACLACLVAVACSDESDVLGTRADGGAGGGGLGPGSAGTTTDPGGGSAAVAGETSGAGASALGGAAGKPAGGSSSSGSAGKPSGTGGSSGSGAGGRGGANASGEAGQAGAGMSGGAGAGGAATTGCPNGCTRSAAYPGCSGQVWQCSLGFSDQEFRQAGCMDLGTDLARYCCPESSYPGCGTPCADAKTLTDCEARSDCHSVFNDPGTCGCGSVGCCAHFSRCAEGGTATCKDPGLSCTIATPFCEKPAYVLSYSNGCYEGCVQPKDCAP